LGQWDNTKDVTFIRNNGRRKKEEGAEEIFDVIMAEIFPKLVRYPNQKSRNLRK